MNNSQDDSLLCLRLLGCSCFIPPHWALSRKTHTWMSVCRCVCVCVCACLFPFPFSFISLMSFYPLFPPTQWLILCSQASLECSVMSESLFCVVLFLFVPSVLFGISFCRQCEGMRPPVPVTHTPTLTQTHHDLLGNAAQLLLLCLCLWLSHSHEENESSVSAK